MLPWVLYVILVTLLVGMAALVAEKAARLRRARGRGIRRAAMAASVLIPLAAGSISLQLPASLHAAVPGGAAALRHLTAESLSTTRWIPADAARAISSQDIDAWLTRLWILASSALAIVLTGSAANLRWRRRTWVVRSVAGVAVYVAPDIGPAVVGVFRPRIVVPHWLTDLPDTQQSLVIAHERAHLQAKDPQALAVALCLLVCTPWKRPAVVAIAQAASRQRSGLRRGHRPQRCRCQGVWTDPAGRRSAAVAIDQLGGRYVPTPIVPGREDRHHAEQTIQILGTAGHRLRRTVGGAGGGGHADPAPARPQCIARDCNGARNCGYSRAAARGHRPRRLA